MTQRRTETITRAPSLSKRSRKVRTWARAQAVPAARKRIKELHDLEIDRTSCTSFWANQFRVLLTAAAYVLMQELL